MLFGMDGDGPGAWEGGIIGAVITAAFAGLLAILKLILPWYSKGQQQRKRREAGIYQDIIRRMEEQAERDQDVIRQQQRAIEVLQEANTECREETAELRAAVHFLYDTARRHSAALRHLGQDPGELPELPRLRDRMSERADFLARQAAQSAGLTEAARQEQPRPPESSAGP
jgi:chromosome segregation ATPase